jgi:hypothetical protein
MEKVEKLLNVKIVKTETVKGKAFPLFDLANIQGVRLALIKNPLFVIIDEDVYEKRVEGDYVVVQNGNEYLLMKYEGEPNIDILRSVENTKTEVQKEDEAGKQETEEEAGKEDDEKQGRDEEDPVKEILEKLPKWADGAVVMEKDGLVVLPVKRSAKGEGYYASTTWRPLDVQGVEELLNHVITKNGKVTKVNIYIRDKYINIYINSRRGGKHARG